MAFTAKDVMALREKTGAGVMDCKKALTDADGDMSKAADLLRERGIAKAEKKASRIAAEGIVACYIDGKTGVLVELNCESDFVAKNPQFSEIANEVAKVIIKYNPANVEELLEQNFVDDESTTISGLINAAVAKIGEKISIRRFVRIEGAVDTYVHMGGKIGVIVEVEGNADKAVMHDVAMQIAAAKPTCISKEDVDQSEIEKEKEILKAQALNEPKPKPMNIIEKMVEGRIEKYYKEVCLLEQPFVKEQDKTVAQMINGMFVVKSFVRYEMGEGLQKREDNFAEEVMSQMGK